MLSDMKTHLSLIALLVGITAAEALSNPIALTFSGVATGTFGTTSFTNQPFTVTSQGTPASVTVND